MIRSRYKKQIFSSISIWTFVRNMLDGRVHVYFLRSRKEAEKFAENDENRFENDIQEQILSLDTRTLDLFHGNSHEYEKT